MEARNDGRKMKGRRKEERMKEKTKRKEGAMDGRK
jgi:hypothetical protein